MHNIPEDLFYTDSHEWVKFTDNDNAIIGITDFAQSELSDVVFVNLCQEGDTLDEGETIGDVESIKAVSELFTPFAGTVVKINEDVVDSPETLNSAPYDAWLIEISGDFDKSNLLGAGEYKELLEREA